MIMAAVCHITLFDTCTVPTLYIYKEPNHREAL